MSKYVVWMVAGAVVVGCGGCGPDVDVDSGSSGSSSGASSTGSSSTPMSSSSEGSSTEADDGETSTGTTGAPQNACGDRPTPHLCNDSGSECLCPDAELGSTDDWLSEKFALGDVDGDGNVDVASVQFGGGVVVRLSDGNALSEPIAVGEGSPVLYSGGELGIAYYDASGPEPVVGLVEADGLGTPSVLETPLDPSGHTRAGDFDGNASLDLLTAYGDEMAVWARTLMNIAGGPEDTTAEIAPPTRDMGAVITGIADFNGDGATDVFVTPLWDFSQRIAFGGPDGLGSFATVESHVSPEGQLYPFPSTDGTGQLYIQPGACSDCLPPLGGAGIFEFVGPEGFQSLGYLSGDDDLQGGGARALVTSSGTMAVTLYGINGQRGVMGSALEFRDILDFDSPRSFTINSGLYSAWGTMPFDDGERLIVRVGAVGTQLMLFSYETLE